MTIAAIQSELIMDASASSIAAENSREHGASTKRYGPMQALAREAFRMRTTPKAKFGGYRSCLPTTWSGLLLHKPDHPALAHGSLYYTDEWQAYATLRMRGEHVIIRKEKGRPVGRDHING